MIIFFHRKLMDLGIGKKIPVGCKGNFLKLSIWIIVMTYDLVEVNYDCT